MSNNENMNALSDSNDNTEDKKERQERTSPRVNFVKSLLARLAKDAEVGEDVVELIKGHCETILSETPGEYEPKEQAFIGFSIDENGQVTRTSLAYKKPYPLGDWARRFNVAVVGPFRKADKAGEIQTVSDIKKHGITPFMTGEMYDA